MNKKIIFIFIVSFLLLNIIFLKDFFYNSYSNYLFSNKDFSGAINNFSKTGNIYGTYNLANSLYKQKKYQEGVKEYLSILGDEKTEFNFRINHNLGNSYYKLGEQKSDEEKVKFFEKSVLHYRKALDIKYNEETKNNLDFVLDKIKKLQEKSKQEQQKQEEQKSTGSGSDNSENKSGSGSENKSSSPNENSSPKSQKQDDKGESSLTEEQLQQIEDYSKSLKEQEKSSSAGFNKVYKGGQNDQNISDFEALFDKNPFFNNSPLEGGKEEKDW